MVLAIASVSVAAVCKSVMHVLTADDHETMRIGVRTLLEQRTDIEVHFASNGLEAIETALRIRPDLVILDLTMPVMSGYTATKQLRKLVPEIPILWFTIHSSSWLLEEAKLLGVQGFLNKADAAKMLLIAVEELVERKGTFFPNSTDPEPAAV
jgi:DNA-binding NarL/FixJ family response regulator